MGRLSGWQRLWAVGCVLAAIVLSVAGSEIETEKQVRDSWEQIKNTRSREIAQQGAEMLEGVQSSQAREALYELSQVQIDRAMVRLDSLRDQALLDLPARQGAQARRLIYAWFAWAAATYAIGWAIGWIYRGFRPKAA
ncbi:hypothetical protein cym2001_52590 [Pseudomonas sp. CYM-20-01]|nr:hypothetical protein cym2001_52590 [Pseudomonas sp. CYM-20-01]